VLPHPARPGRPVTDDESARLPATERARLETRIASLEDEAKRAFEDAQREADALFAQYQLSQLVASGGSLAELAGAVLLELTRLAAGDEGAVWLGDRPGGSLELAAEIGSIDDVPARLMDPAAARAWAAGRADLRVVVLADEPDGGSDRLSRDRDPGDAGHGQSRRRLLARTVAARRRPGDRHPPRPQRHGGTRPAARGVRRDGEPRAPDADRADPRLRGDAPRVRPRAGAAAGVPGAHPGADDAARRSNQPDPRRDAPRCRPADPRADAGLVRVARRPVARRPRPHRWRRPARDRLAARPAADRGRPEPGRADPGEPRRQRPEVRAGRIARHDRGGGRRRLAGRPRRRRGDRRPGGGPPTRGGAVPSGLERSRVADPRHGPGPVHLSPPGGGPRWQPDDRRPAGRSPGDARPIHVADPGRAPGPPAIARERTAAGRAGGRRWLSGS